MKKKAALHNLGCKVNAYETEAMQELLEQNGYEIVPFKEGADVYIINTCTVTNVADRKSRQMLHKARKMNPDAVVVATGCYVQARGEDIDPCVDIVVGNNKKKDLITILDEYYADRMHEDRKENILVKDSADTCGCDGECNYSSQKNDDTCGCGGNCDCQKSDNDCSDAHSDDGKHEEDQHKVKKELIDINHEKEYEEMQVTHTAEHTRAYIKVQDGCNQFCSYCIIPYARGRVRSRNLENVLEEVRTLAVSGYKEVVLTGIHLSSYGIDTGDSLLELIQKVHEVDGIHRIRLGSLEPRIITEEFASSIAALPKMCPHFHLSLQSGCNATLKRMNRRYSAEEYMEKCDLLRKHFHNPALTTDVIVGFPGETEEEFAESMDFVERVNFYETHIFKYSRRAGTKAAVMPDQIPEEIKAERSAKMIELGHKKQRAYEEKLLGTTQEVLMEEAIETEDGIYQVGHTKEYVKIGLKTEENLSNQLINVKIEDTKQIIH